jgi:hypothetical protein
MNAAARCKIWPPGTYGVVWSWGAANRKLASNRLRDWFDRYWHKSPTGRPNDCSGLSTMARRLVASARQSACASARHIVVHTPVPASWLNQIEIYFSIIQRKVLTPNDFTDLDAVRLRLALYEELSNGNPRPLQWKFSNDDLAVLLEKVEARERLLHSVQLQGYIDVV